MILEKLKEMLKRINPEIDTDTVDESTDLALELGLDSLSVLMLAYEIEEEYGFFFEQTVQFKTVGDVCKYIACQQEQNE